MRACCSWAAGLPGCEMDGATHPRISSAAADMVGQCCIDFLIGHILLASNQCRGLHDHARLAISALRDVLFDPCFLTRMVAVTGEALDGHILFTWCLLERRLAGANWSAVFMHRASAAHAHAASVFRSSQLEEVAQYPEKRHLRVSCYMMGNAIYVESEVGHMRLYRLRRARVLER